MATGGPGSFRAHAGARTGPRDDDSYKGPGPAATGGPKSSDARATLRGVLPYCGRGLAAVDGPESASARAIASVRAIAAGDESGSRADAATRVDAFGRSATRFCLDVGRTASSSTDSETAFTDWVEPTLVGGTGACSGAAVTCGSALGFDAVDTFEGKGDGSTDSVAAGDAACAPGATDETRCGDGRVSLRVT
jgi:hypothetical protein